MSNEIDEWAGIFYFNIYVCLMILPFQTCGLSFEVGPFAESGLASGILLAQRNGMGNS